MEDIYPYIAYEGIKIHDWDKWEDPFRLTMDAYWKYQAEKERKLYAIIDAFNQNNGHLNVTDARYVNTVKLFISGISPLEYVAHRGFAHAGRAFPGPGPRVACLMQSLDEIRHAQTQVHSISNYNKYYNGMHDFHHMHDRVWFLSVPKSFFDDAITAGPFEFMVSIGFSFEYVLTNLLFVPFVSGAAYNGDMGTMTFGFSAQSDEARHMTLGLEVIKFILEQDPANVPIVQRWIDKWTWRGYRVLTLVAMMMDYMLPKRTMSWKEAWEVYFEENGGALFKDLARYGITMPKCAEQIALEKDHLSHQAWSTFYNYAAAANFHTWMPDEDEMAWLSAQVPGELRQALPPALRVLARAGRQGQPLLQQDAAHAVPDLPDPDDLHRAGRPDQDLLPRGRLQGRQVPLLLRPLQGDLRARAGEVRPGLAAGAPDLPGQLLPRGHRPDGGGLRPARRGAEVLQPRARPRQPRLRHLRGQEELRRVARPGDEEHLSHAGCGRPGPQRSSDR